MHRIMHLFFLESYDYSQFSELHTGNLLSFRIFCILTNSGDLLGFRTFRTRAFRKLYRITFAELIESHAVKVCRMKEKVITALAGNQDLHFDSTYTTNAQPYLAMTFADNQYLKNPMRNA